MRIAHVITSYHPIVGGAERQVAQLARLAGERGHEVCVVTRRRRGLAPAEVVDGVPVFRVGGVGPKPTAATAFVLGAVARLARVRPDVIHCHSLWSPALAGSLAASMTDAVSLAKPMRGGEVDLIASKPLGRRRLAYLTSRIDAFPAVSQEIATELARHGAPADRIRPIPNGVDTELYRPVDPDSRARLRARLGLSGDGPLVLFAGRLSEQKRLPLLLAAWPAVRAQVPDATLLIAEASRIGEAGAETAIRGAIAATPGVTGLGHIEDMPSLLGAVDVFVLPSASEGMSNALLEACAAGLACVASDVGGNRDLIRPGRNGALFPSGDREALAAALTAMLRDHGLRLRLGQAARATVEDHFGIARTCSLLLDLYGELGASRGRLDVARGQTT